MPVSTKRKLRGADGGKHPHVKNAQDYHNPPADSRKLFLDQTHQYLAFLDWWTNVRQDIVLPSHLETAVRASVGALEDHLKRALATEPRS